MIQIKNVFEGITEKSVEVGYFLFDPTENSNPPTGSALSSVLIIFLKKCGTLYGLSQTIVNMLPDAIMMIKLQGFHCYHLC